MGKVSSELGQRIYIDTNIVIYAIEGLANYAAQVQPLLWTHWMPQKFLL